MITLRRIRPPLSSSVLALGLSACTEFGPRVYTAHPFLPDETCVAASVPIGIVQADELASTCAPVCLFLDETLYVSAVCAPYPARAASVAPEDSPECVSALALLEAEARCGDAPPEPSDAGIMDDAASDSQPPAP
jgi:hypothetical protein